MGWFQCKLYSSECFGFENLFIVKNLHLTVKLLEENSMQAESDRLRLTLQTLMVCKETKWISFQDSKCFTILAFKISQKVEFWLKNRHIKNVV